MKSKRPADLISDLWKDDAGAVTIIKAKEYLKKHSEALNELQHNDPAAFLFLVGDKARRVLAAENLKSLSPPLYEKPIRKNIKKLKEKNDSVKPSSGLFSWKWGFVAAAASLFILLGIILISRTYLFRHESRQNITENSNPAEDLKKNDVYDKDISRRTGTTLVSMEAVGQGKAGYKNAHNTEKSIATNLVTDGEKIIHYTMDNGTEVIFITGLN